MMNSKIRDDSIMTVFEHQRLTTNDFNQPSDFVWLLEQEFSVFSVKRQRGQWQLKVGHYIGIILLPSGITLEILPKLISGQIQNSKSHIEDILLTRQWVQRMLTDLTTAKSTKHPHSKHLGQFRHNLQSLSAQTLPLSHWIIMQFLQHLLAYQPTKHYQTQVYNQSVLQGKLLIKEQLRHNHTQPYKFISEVNVLSQDTLGNRIIKSALLLLESLLFKQLKRTSRFNDNYKHNSKSYQNEPEQSVQTILSTALIPWRQIAALHRHELRTLDTLYLNAKRQLNLQPLPKQQLQIAQQLLELSYWLLQMQQPNMLTGSSLNQHSISSQLQLCLLINMNQAFEQWASLRIGTLFRQLDLGYEPLYQAQHLWLSADKGQACLSIRPDLLIYHLTIDQAQTYSHVIDIKWKNISDPSEISASDAYQLTSYAQAYQAEQVWLVYPVTDNKQHPVRFRQHAHGALRYGNGSQAKLWLMPFNVFTGTLNSWSHNNIEEEE